MDTLTSADLLCDLIRIPSLTGEEREALLLLEQWFREWGWEFERIGVSETRWDLLVSFGTPSILYTTHIDVVPAPPSSFEAIRDESMVRGRGACDAKGALLAMIAAVHRLRLKGSTDFGLLVVVGEETDGIGALTAARALQGRGVRFLIDGEPTEGKLMRGHRGYVAARLSCRGKACHSGYPHLGVDANRALVNLLARLSEDELPRHPELGHTLINFGLFSGGVAANVISPLATAELSLRSPCSGDLVITALRTLVGEQGELEILGSWEPVECRVVSGFEIDYAAFATDIPNFESLGATPLLYGPGSIHHAHTDGEHLAIGDFEGAINGYERLYMALAA